MKLKKNETKNIFVSFFNVLYSNDFGLSRLSPITHHPSPITHHLSLIARHLFQNAFIGIEIFENILANDIKFEIDSIADFDVLEICMFKSIRNNSYRKHII